MAFRFASRSGALLRQHSPGSRLTDPNPTQGRFSQQEIERQPVWNSLQEHLKVLSPRSSRIIARNSGHDVMIDRPDVLLNAIREVIGEVRGNAAYRPIGTITVQ